MRCINLLSLKGPFKAFWFSQKKSPESYEVTSEDFAL